MLLHAPAVYEWVARMWNSKQSTIPIGTVIATPGSLPPSWDKLLQLLPDFLNYYHLNALAYKNSQKEFI